MKPHGYDYTNFLILLEDNEGIKRSNSLWHPPIIGWVSHFDIEGVRDKLDEDMDSLKESLGNILPAVKDKLKEMNQNKKDDMNKIYFNYYQDTFIFYSRTKDNVE